MASGGLYLGSVSLTSGLGSVNISATNGDPIGADAGTQGMKVVVVNPSAIATSNAVLDPCVLGTQVQVLSSVGPSTNVIMSDGTSPITAITKTTPLPALSVGLTGRKRVSIFGSVITLAPDGANPPLPLNLKIVYSYDGLVWYDSSLGTLTFTTTGDFSRDWETSARLVSMYADTGATAVIYGCTL